MKNGYFKMKDGTEHIRIPKMWFSSRTKKGCFFDLGISGERIFIIQKILRLRKNLYTALLPKSWTNMTMIINGDFYCVPIENILDFFKGKTKVVSRDGIAFIKSGERGREHLSQTNRKRLRNRKPIEIKQEVQRYEAPVNLELTHDELVMLKRNGEI